MGSGDGRNIPRTPKLPNERLPETHSRWAGDVARMLPSLLRLQGINDSLLRLNDSYQYVMPQSYDGLVLLIVLIRL